jgi:hypothetical protein
MIDLFLRYPELSDASAGPAHYRPADAFEIVRAAAQIILLFATALTVALVATRQKRLDPNPPP